jgi:hypothetical protein
VPLAGPELAGADHTLQLEAGQPLLWMAPGEHPEGVWTDVDPYEGWPFGASLPYTQVRATQAVADGTANIVAVVRDHDGGWRFLDGADDRQVTVAAQLRHIVDTHPDVAAVADLTHGQRADRNAEGRWTRTPSPV